MLLFSYLLVCNLCYIVTDFSVIPYGLLNGCIYFAHSIGATKPAYAVIQNQY